MRIRIIFLTIIGFLFLIIGAIGVFLPVLPTTPFVIVGTGCLAGTPKLQAKILRIPFFREYIENYQNRKGLSRKTLIKSLCFLWGMLILSMILTGKLWLILLLTFIGTCVTIHIILIAKPKTKKSNPVKTEVSE
ncbi:MAG: YbaN family protein [Lachnospiraceae bacterium]